MFCTKCGAKMDDGQRFCSNCGAPANMPEEETKPQSFELNEKPPVSFDEQVPPAEETPAEPPRRPGKQKKIRPERPKRSGAGKWIVLGVLGVILIALAALAAFRWNAVTSFATNLYEKTFLSPEEYYQRIERKTIEAYLDNAEQQSDVATRMLNSDKDFFTETELRLSLNQKALSDELLDLMEDEIGVDITWFENLGFYLSTGKADDLIGGSLSVFLNDKDIVSADLTFDPASETLYTKVPELSGRFFKVNPSELNSSGAVATMTSSNLDPEIILTLIDRYSEIVIDDLTKVEKGRETVTAGGFSAGYTALEVKIDGKVMLKIAKDVLKKAQNDKEVEELLYFSLGNMGYTGAKADEMYDQFMGEIEDTLARLDEMDPKEISQSILMTVYVDGQGHIRGRHIRLREEKETVAELSYALVTSGLKYGLRAEYKADDSWDGYTSQQNIILDGSGSVSLSREMTGSFDLRVKMVNGREGSEEKIDMKALKLGLEASAKDKKISYEITITPTKDLLNLALEDAYNMPSEVEDLIRDLSLRLSGETNNRSFSMNLALLNGKKDLLTLSEKFYEVKAFDIAVPSDAMDAQDWAASIDYSKIEGLMAALTEAGVPASVLYNIGYYF